MRYRAFVFVALVLAGCASTPQGGADAKPSKSGPGGVTMHEDKDFDWAWTETGLDFTAYDTLMLARPRADVPGLQPEDAESLEWARGLVLEKFVPVLRDSRLFKAIVTREADIPPGAKVIYLDTTIIQYEKGNAAARAFTGLGGHPVIAIQGRLLDGNRQVFAFEELRGGGVSVRPFAAFRPNRDLQQADLTDIAQLLVDHIARVTGRRR